MFRKVINGLFAFSLCGLWHGAGWNFLIWGVYHGVGIAVNNLWHESKANAYLRFDRVPVVLRSSISWFATLMFVMVGWLYFFFPVSKATHMLAVLIGLR